MTDGAGRTFVFAYDSEDQLTSITAPDNTCIGYAYTDGVLSGVTYPDGSKAVITSSPRLPASVTLKDAEENTLYSVEYQYANMRVARIDEYGAGDTATAGKWSSMSIWHPPTERSCSLLNVRMRMRVSRLTMSSSVTT